MDKKPIPGYPGYYATREGQIIGVKGNALKPWLTKWGYHQVETSGRKRPSVHRLVALAYHPNPDDLPQVHHKDEVKTNNRPDNLEWKSAVDNTTISQGRAIMVEKDGVGIWSPSVRAFCRKRGLSDANFGRLLRGQYKQMNGWRLSS